MDKDTHVVTPSKLKSVLSSFKSKLISSLTKSDVGLGNVDNTADADKNVKSLGGEIFTFGKISATTLKNSYGYTGSTKNGYFDAFVRYIAKNYASDVYIGKVFIGYGDPNSNGVIVYRSYSNQDVNDEGYPKYSGGIFIDVNGDLFAFGTSNYVFTLKKVTVSVDTTS